MINNYRLTNWSPFYKPFYFCFITHSLYWIIWSYKFFWCNRHRSRLSNLIWASMSTGNKTFGTVMKKIMLSCSNEIIGSWPRIWTCVQDWLDVGPMRMEWNRIRLVDKIVVIVIVVVVVIMAAGWMIRCRCCWVDQVAAVEKRSPVQRQPLSAALTSLLNSLVPYSLKGLNPICKTIVMCYCSSNGQCHYIGNLNKTADKATSTTV